MQFSALVALAVAALPALAVPTPEAALGKRALTVFVCTGDNFDGQCVDFTPPDNVCEPFSALGLTGLGSFGPDQGLFCILYSDNDCDGSNNQASNTFTFPGLEPVPDFWQFNTHSWKCFS